MEGQKRQRANSKSRSWLEPWRALLEGRAEVDEKAFEGIPSARLEELLFASSEEFAAALESLLRPCRKPALKESDASQKAFSATRKLVRPAVDSTTSEETSAVEIGPEDFRAWLVLRLGLRTDEFALVVFPERFRLAFSPMHWDLFERRSKSLGEFDPKRPSQRFAVAAPRGHAKSSLLSFLFPLHDLLYSQERYIVLVSATLPQAERRLAHIRAALVDQPELLALFPELKKGFIIASSARELIVPGCKIDAFSAGSEMRGIAHGPWRPTKIILDDAEPSGCAVSPLRRERLREWHNEVIEPLGDSYTRLEVAGTLLHPESLLSELLQRPGFEAKKYQAVVSFAHRQDLWDEWRAILREKGAPAARAFYRANKKAMLENARALWPEKESYYKLMRQMEHIGRRAFLKEKQNEPRFRENMIFDTDVFRWFEVSPDKQKLLIQGGEEMALDSLSLAGFLDPATGGARSGKGDDAAIAILGAAGGNFYVLETWMRPATPLLQIQMAWASRDRWPLDAFGFECNAFQGLLATPFEEERRRRQAEGLPGDLAVKPVRHSRNKDQRILALQPMVETGRLLFNKALSPTFLAQMEQYPGGAHDDGLDALAAAVELARSLAAQKNATQGMKRVRRIDRGPALL
jgi:hypothetical protein